LETRLGCERVSRYRRKADQFGRQICRAFAHEHSRRLAKEEFVRLGRKLDLRNTVYPVNLLAGADDDITTPEQVLDAAKYIGTPKERASRCKPFPVVNMARGR